MFIHPRIYPRTNPANPGKSKVVEKPNKNDPEGVYSRKNLPKILPKTMTDRANVVNLSKHKSILDRFACQL